MKHMLRLWLPIWLVAGMFGCLVREMDISSNRELDGYRRGFARGFARGYAACADSVRANVGTARRLSATMRPDSAAITTDALGLRVDMTWRQR